jgi:hypothetical protein
LPSVIHLNKRRNIPPDSRFQGCRNRQQVSLLTR